MVEKKEDKKEETKVQAKVSKNTSAKPVELKYNIKRLADTIGVAPMDLLAIYRKANLNERSMITETELKKLYDDII